MHTSCWASLMNFLWKSLYAFGLKRLELHFLTQLKVWHSYYYLGKKFIPFSILVSNLLNEFHLNKTIFQDFHYFIWKKVEEYLRLFETCGGIWFSLFPVSFLGKLMLFSGRMGLRMKLTAKKELILLFQMTPSRILCDQ